MHTNNGSIRCPKCGHMFENDVSASSAALVEIQVPHFREIEIHDKGRLPHWDVEGGFYFVTFRLADSLPISVLKSAKAHRRRLASETRIRGEKITKTVTKKIDAKINKQIETALDTGYGSCVLADPRNAEIVANSINFFDSERYRIFCWCVMPNHVHVVFKLLPGYELSKIMQSWKSYSSKEINRILGRTGKLWEREYFDRLIRDETHFHRAIRYVINNPVKARLENWRWVWLREKILLEG